MYTVTSSKAGSNREMGEFPSLDEAIQKARECGAIIPRKGTRTEVGLSVRGFEKRDDYAVWIEEIRV